MNPSRALGRGAVLVATALCVSAAFAAAAEAGTVRVTASIQGAGSVDSVEGGPYNCSRTSNQNDQATVTCHQGVYEAGLEAWVWLRAHPASSPTGHWSFVTWQGCDTTRVREGFTECAVHSGPFTADNRFPKAIFNDSVGPTVTNLTTGLTPGAERTGSFFFSSNEAGSFQCSFDGGAYSGCSSGVQRTFSTEGPHTVQVRAFDQSGNVSASASGSVHVVDTALTGDTSGLVGTRGASFTFSTVGGSQFECQLDGGGFEPCSSPKSYTSLSDGLHTFQVRARNGLWVDQVAASRTWTVDATAPNTTILDGPDEGEVSTSTAATFSFGSTEAGTFECRLDGAAFTSCTTPKTFTGLAAGRHSFEVRAKDNAQNRDQTPATRTWTVQPPDADGDGYHAGQDCNDGNRLINPARPEILDNDVDENCDGVKGINLDRDRDGAQRPADCHDGDAKIRPGAVDVAGNGVDEDCSGGDAAVVVVPGPPPLPPVTEQVIVTMAWDYKAFSKHTKLTRLVLGDIPSGATVTVTCKGKKCPKKRFTKRGAADKLALKAFAKKRLRSGVALTITVTKPDAIGAVRVMKIRARKPPLVSKLCLPVGATKPAECA